MWIYVTRTDALLLRFVAVLGLIGCDPYSSAPREHVTCFAGDAVVFDADVPCAVTRDNGDTVVGNASSRNGRSLLCDTAPRLATITSPCIITPLPESGL